MRITILVSFVLLVLAMASGQDYSQLFAGFGPYLRQTAGMRDPRSNRGPVLFPPGPAPNSADTSGVIVGASGYGFVPPNQASRSASCTRSQAAGKASTYQSKGEDEGTRSLLRGASSGQVSRRLQVELDFAS
ncbi:worker-enriched antennal transcript isoform X2 [Calliopsis andreniformis]|uniref:worker-enriched antennal transcript isoform X2 n=1 Tax=Calliopsis andreniformis TaxID=337506 RepID=UPI003FCE1C47